MGYRYTVKPGEALNIWQMDKVEAVPFEAPYATFDPEDRFRRIGVEAIDMKGIAEIVYPVRSAFLQEDYITDAPYIDRDFHGLYFPWANRKVDFSTFCHRPKVLSVYTRVFFHCETACDIAFNLKTCGGVKVWLNGEEVLLYKAYERNVPNSRHFTVSAKTGTNELLVFANDLAERDVFFYYELTNESQLPLMCHVPLDQPQEKIDGAKAFLSSIYLEKDTYVGEPIVLRYGSNLLKEAVTLFWGPEQVAVTLAPEKDYAIIGDAGNWEDPYFNKTSSDYFPIGMEVDGLKIATRLYLATYNSRLTQITPAVTIEGRKQQSLKVTVTEANEGEIGTALALLAYENTCSKRCRDIIETHMERIEERLDCADFRLAVILVMVDRYGHLLPEDLKARIKTAALNFRYWCDEPGNDVMWFFSENHALLFHVAQYLTGHLYPGERFVSGRTSEAQKDMGYRRIHRWFEEFLPVGFGEWNSLTYLPVDCIAFFTLYAIAPDDRVRSLAAEALDYTFDIIAENLHHTVFATSYGRTYEHTLKGLALGELAMYAWIAWGQGTVNVKNHATTLFAISNYEPRAHREKRDLSQGRSHTFTRHQGHHRAKTYIHKRAEYSLASAGNFYPFETGVQQHFINLSFSEAQLPIWLNHPGERVFSGHNRPSYWAGWQTIPLMGQHKNLLMAGIRMKDSDEVDFIHASLPLTAFDSYEAGPQWFLFRKGNAYGAFWFAGGYRLTLSGANTKKELIAPGRANGVIIKCGAKAEFGSYQAFKKAVTEADVTWSAPEDMTFMDPQFGPMKLDKKGLHKETP